MKSFTQPVMIKTFKISFFLITIQTRTIKKYFASITKMYILKLCKLLYFLFKPTTCLIYKAESLDQCLNWAFIIQNILFNLRALSNTIHTLQVSSLNWQFHCVANIIIVFWSDVSCPSFFKRREKLSWCNFSRASLARVTKLRHLIV